MYICTGKPAFVLALATALTLAGTAEATRLGETRTRQYRTASFSRTEDQGQASFRG